ncbi:hypothetical protein DHD32_10215 [Arenibacter sp. TNZ]|nr:hypothetical protein [Arenibacter sp. TNZ]
MGYSSITYYREEYQKVNNSQGGQTAEYGGTRLWVPYPIHRAKKNHHIGLGTGQQDNTSTGHSLQYQKNI